MQTYTNKRWVTSDLQLRKLLRQCRKCSWYTMNGNLILPYDDIVTAHVPQKKFTMILNTNKSPDASIGHWLTCHVDVKTGIATLHDSLNEIEKFHPNVLQKIKLFCKIRNLTLNILRLKTQESKNVNCGIHSIWFTHKSHDLNSNALLKLKSLFQTYPVSVREQFVMNNVLSVFHF